ncbi:hypothetical protein HHI36_014258 [Cryptolaemus montrouzieri]|uniref:Uncharacterized protein n=1 Tax=Cryptolaemus montrouzieri TaxID=559131 RepID=A0ABD2N2J7_9CUCU
MQRQDDSRTSKSDNYVNITPIEEFESRKEKFIFYFKRLENYCLMKSIVNAKKKAQLLCMSIGSAHYNNLAVLLGPEKSVKALNYGKLVKSFRTILIPFTTLFFKYSSERKSQHIRLCGVIIQTYK